MTNKQKTDQYASQATSRLVENDQTATGLGLCFEDRVYLERVNQYFRHTQGNILHALSLAFIFFLPVLYFAGASLDYLAVWTLACIVSTVVTLFVEKKVSGKKLDVETARLWVARRVWTGNSLGALYGITPLLLPDGDVLVYEFLLFMLLSGVMVSASFSYLVIPLHAFINSLVTLGPFSFYCFIQGDAPHVILGGFTLIWQVFVLLQVVKASRTGIQAIELQDKLSQANLDLQTAKDEVEEASKAKSHFMAAASHDLRQPLYAIRLFNEAIASEALAEENKEVAKFTGRIDRAAGALTELLETVLDLSKLESGNIDYRHATFPVSAVLEDLVNFYKPLAENKKIGLSLVESSAVIRSDPLHLKRILDNILSNAIRYTETGRVLIGCRNLGKQVRIECWDTGIGIGKQDLKHIFDEFYQVSNEARQREKGFGLGLSIANRTAKMLGHQLKVRSIPGKGSVFSVSMPQSINTKNDLATVDPEKVDLTDVKNKRVVVVEDDELVREATLSLLSSWGLLPYGAETADAGRQVLREMRRKGIAPDLFLVDHQLPGDVNGIEFYQANATIDGKFVPGILISGDTNPDHLADFQKSRLTHLTKPISTKELQRTVRNLINLP